MGYLGEYHTWKCDWCGHEYVHRTQDDGTVPDHPDGWTVELYDGLANRLDFMPRQGLFCSLLCHTEEGRLRSNIFGSAKELYEEARREAREKLRDLVRSAPEEPLKDADPALGCMGKHFPHIGMCHWCGCKQGMWNHSCSPCQLRTAACDTCHSKLPVSESAK